MLAVYASAINRDDPLSGLTVGERPEPEIPDGWTAITVRAASLNHHDLWSLRGVGLPEDRLPMILGCDAAGIDADGNEVIAHSVINDPVVAWRRDARSRAGRCCPSATRARSPTRSPCRAGTCVPKPPELSFEEASCLPTAWLTAYRMLFTRGALSPGSTVLVQGATGGVATALTVLGSAAGIRMWVTGRSEEKRAHALELGADQVFEPGARMPERVDAVMETIGQATWAHSVRALKPGGKIVISGATTGDAPPAELTRIFFLQLSVIGSTMGTREELGRLIRMCIDKGVRPAISRTVPLADARQGFEAMLRGETAGKIVLTNS